MGIDPSCRSLEVVEQVKARNDRPKDHLTKPGQVEPLPMASMSKAKSKRFDASDSSENMLMQ